RKRRGVGIPAVDRDGDESKALAGRLVEGLPRDLAEIVDVVREVQMLRVARRERVEVSHYAVLPDESAAAREARGAGQSDDRALAVDPEPLAVDVALKRSEVLHAGVFRPDERVRV